jgi:AraC family transcriptional regulator, arabinose operon regulatory protein
MLSENMLSVNDIAHLVGYNDCSYFCAVFKKYEMISPTEFRGL